jgi:putative FmdB family regulatory protein
MARTIRLGFVARYEYLCKDCGSTFELQRSMADAEGDVRCPSGHTQVRRRFSVFATVGGSTSSMPEPAMGGGGCCGGACGCGR